MIRSKQSRQYVVLLAANLLTVAVNFGTVLLLTRIMSQADFGYYRYALTFLAVVGVTAQFGIPYSTSVLLTRTHVDRSARQLITVATFAMLAVALAAVVALGLGLTALTGLGVKVNPALAIALPLVYVAILQLAYIEMLKGANKIAAISFQTIVPPAGLLVVAVVLWATHAEQVPFAVMLATYAATYTVVHLVTWWRYREPWRRALHETGPQLRQTVKSTGRHVYVGSLVAVMSGNLLNLILGHVIGMRDYALYGVALSMAVPMQMVPSIMGTVLFKQNASVGRLSARSTAATFAITGLGLAAYLLALRFAFPVVFPPEYARASGITMYLAAVYAVFGLGDFFNRFIGAHGFGTYIKRGAVIAGASNVTVSLSLMVPLGITGVIAGSATSATLYFAAMVFYYRRVSAIRMSDGKAASASPTLGTTSTT
jgi:O-antigen/teichoic acid export membrane protein